MSDRSFLKRILATYFCIMIIPMLCGTIIYEYILSKNNDRVIQVLESSFENNIDEVVADLAVIESTIESVAFNPELSKFFYDYDMSENNISTNEMLAFKRLLTSYRFDNDITDTVFIYSKHLNLLIDPDNIYHDPTSFFSNYYCVESESAADTFNRIAEGNDKKYVYNLKTQNDYVKYPVIEFQKPVPIFGVQRNGSITVLIKSDNLFAPFSRIMEESKGSMKVYYDDELIYENGSVLKKEKVKTFSLTRENTKWRYELLIPESYIMKDTRTMNMFLLLVNMVAFIVGSLVCVCFAMKKVRAYQDIILKMDLVESDFESGKGDEIEKIGRFINELVKNKDEAEQELLEQKRIGNTYDCIHKLLYGGYKSSKEAQYAINENGVVFSGNKYAVMVLSFETGAKSVSDEINIKNFVQNTLTEFTENLAYTYCIDLYNVAVLVSYDGDEAEFGLQLKNMVSAIRVDLVYKHNMSVRIGVGKITADLNDISVSRACAEDVVNYIKTLGEEKVVLHSELPGEEEEYCYDTDLEEKIIRAVNVGDGDRAVEILRTIKEKNLAEKSLSLSKVKKLATRIETTMLKISEKVGADGEFAAERKSLSELFDYAVEYVKIAASSVKRSSDKRSDILHNEIVEYVKKNYADNELSLEKLSARFNLNVAYTSTVFRKKTGDTFLHYVERLRINKACEMILTSEYKIAAIAKEVGYTNDTSFRRSFKRITGVSPSQYYADKIKEGKQKN